MQHFIVFTTFLAISSASSIAFYAATPQLRATPLILSSHSSSLVTPTQQQYHTQDELGQYAYGYSEPNSAKQEVRSLDGITRGSYSYFDSEGKLQTVDYTADEEGFRVAATNLPRAAGTVASSEHQPIPVTDTDAVAAARAAHLAAHKAANSHNAESESDSIVINEASSAVKTPSPAQDTVEVAAAKVAHLKRVEHEKQRNEILTKPGFIYANAFPVAFRSAVYPGIYSYPFNSRFLASSYVF